MMTIKEWREYYLLVAMLIMLDLGIIIGLNWYF
jgi:hypothetical protein